MPTPDRSPPRITVCICTHERVDYVRECLDGLRAQTAPRDAFDVVVVDSASSAGAASALAALVAAMPGALLIREDRPGVSIARNTGLAAAGDGYAAFIDDDAIAAPDWVEAIARAVATEHPPVIIGGRVLPIWERTLPAWWPRSLRPVLSIIEHEAGGEYRSVALPARLEPYAVNMIVHAPTARAAGGFREDLGRAGTQLLSDEEVELAWRLQDAGHSIRYDPSVLVHHQIQAARLNPAWLLERMRMQAISTVWTRRILGEPSRNWIEAPRRLAVLLLTLPARVLPANSTALIGLRWRHAYAAGFLRGLFGGP